MVASFCLVVLLAAQVEPAPTADLKQEVGRLVRQLNSDELTRRDQAEQALIALGPVAAAHAPATSDATPAEVVQRLARVRQAWERERARLASQETKVSLKGDFTLAEALEELGRQTGNTLVDRREVEADGREAKLHLDFSDVPFWQCLDQLLDQAGLDVDHFAGEGSIAIVSRAPGRTPRAKSGNYNGPFRLEAARFEAMNDLRGGGNRFLRLLVDVAWEPRLRPIVISQPLDQIHAKAGEQTVDVDGQGEPTAPIAEGTTGIELAIPLVSPPRSAERITSLKGQLHAVVPSEVESFRFAELPLVKDGGGKKVIQQRKAAVTVTLESLRKNNDVWELTVRVRFDDPANSLDSYLSGWLLSNEALLEKPDKPPIEPAGYEQTRQTPNEVGVKYLFDLPDGPQGYAFVYKSPTAVFNISIDYEFKNLDLP